MTADPPGTDELRPRPPGEAKQPSKPISRAQIETVLARSVAGVSFIFALQAVPVVLGQMDERRSEWALPLTVLFALAIVLVVVSAVTKTGVRVAAASVAVLYLVQLVVWPLFSSDPSAVLDGKPWLWYLCTVATSCAAIAFPVLYAAVYTVIAPVLYGVLRLLPSGGGVDGLLASLDAVYAMLLGQVVLIIIFMIRQAAGAVDVAQTNALHKYGVAVRQHATDVERVEVDSIVHDSVLTTLLSAAGAQSPREARLAQSMAAEAIARLDRAVAVPAGDETVIPFARLSHRIRQAAVAFACPFSFVEQDIDFLTVPVHASEAIYSATVQAMVNSLQHAGSPETGVTRTLTVTANLQGGCTIKIADTGIGFDPDSVPAERLGLRLSIKERVRSAGGEVSVCTGVGRGTVITIDWPRPDDQPDPLVSLFSTEEIPVLGLDAASSDEDASDGSGAGGNGLGGQAFGEEGREP